ncbi:SulP family inorganic anion transporter [Paenibacillus sp. MER 99-2]|uniref:SulP family inorganic anion transporter n=1 Tax=Paenibacillus sp. MER 99-2 TaxID=2939572 RepID=UPI00203F8436|nr:SulP family inorganic anion transporter [Paenibacillus sp. MER 99-2]MCM3174412.1 SulP family inorganic anion transporter [Paenibacillus sp. MER 99-2]
MKWMGRYAGYNGSSFRKDLLSGLIVGIIAIPLGMAFAIASGVKPEYGLYTTVIAGILISLLGGSKFQIGGPTGAFIPILFAIVMQYGYENLLIAGIMAGLMLVLMGLFKLGALIKFIPRPVTIGFTAGIAVIIFSGQIANFLGLRGIEKHEDFWSNMKEIGMHISTVNIYSLLTAGSCLAVILLVPRFAPKVPASLVGLVLSTVVAALFFEGQVTTIGSSFGAIPSALPQFHVPEMTWERIVNLLQPALVIAMLGGIESLLSAVVADGMTGSRHNSNRELIGQGIANMVTPLFGGIPATGAIARTATNIKSGAVSPLSGVIHGVVVLLVIVMFAPYASHIPLASMAPVLMMVAWNMSERRSFMHVMKTKTSDSLVLLITFLLTVFTSLTTAVEVGLIMAVLLFVKRMSEMLKVAKVLPDPNHKHEKVMDYMVREGHDCPQINLYTIEGPLFFGAADRFEKSVMDSIHRRPGILLLRMGKVPFMDTTGESNLAHVVKHMERSRGMVLLSGIQAQPLEMLKKTGLIERINPDHMFEHTGEAINYALAHLDDQKCKGCKHFAFRECAALSGAGTDSERISMLKSGKRMEANSPV